MSCSHASIPCSLVSKQVFGSLGGLLIVRPHEPVSWKPGQFAMIFPSDSMDPLLGRPLGIASEVDGNLLFLCQRVGRGTRILLDMPVGGSIRINAPLGSPINIPNKEKGPLILLGGGFGIASLLALPAVYSTDSMIWAFRGGKEWMELVRSCLDIVYIPKGCEVLLASEDGSMGFRGNGIDAMNSLDLCGATVVACGPSGMLRGVLGASKQRGFKALLGIEQRMACGLGGCLGCSIDLKGNRRARVCKEGPFFPGEDIVDDEIL